MRYPYLLPGRAENPTFASLFQPPKLHNTTLQATSSVHNPYFCTPVITTFDNPPVTNYEFNVRSSP